MNAPNARLVGSPLDARFQTPALVLDLPVLKQNMAQMQARVTAAGRQLRPHVKSHKCASIAKLQIEAGAVGLCCATIREVEKMAEAGCDGIVLTAPVATEAAAARLAAAREKVPSLMAVADSVEGVALLDAAASADRPIGVLVDIDMGLGRTGLIDSGAAVKVAEQIDASPGLRYRGVQAYYGHLQHVRTLAERRAKVMEQWAVLRTFLAALTAAGHAPQIISGGGTGTHHADLAEGPFTEIQAGSYIFMDKQYGLVELAPEGPPFKPSLSIATRVVSTVQPGRVIVDAGLKAMATEQGPASVRSGASMTGTCRFMGDEHGAIDFPNGEKRPSLGDLVMLDPPHCDPTVNLYSHIHVVEDGRLVDIWAVEARGY